MAEVQRSSDPSAVEVVNQLHRSYDHLRTQMGGVIVGLEDVIEQLMIALLCRGHCILEGVPGLAKTKIVSTMASLLNLSFRRVQFTPDLMPSDITGTDVLEEDRTTGKRVFRFIPGPLFGNIVLADEINRTPLKTQSALLEAMEERQLSVGGETYPLPNPFLVLATQNPIEQEGTYTVREAQLDRFMLKVILGYPDFAEEIEIMKRVTTAYHYQTSQVIDGQQLIALQDVVRAVPVADHVYEYAARIVRLTRPNQQEATPYIKENVSWGAGPRASIYLIMGAKARAVLKGRYHATTEDLHAVALPVLRHRVMPTFNAEASGISSDDIVKEVLRTVSGSQVKVGAA